MARPPRPRPGRPRSPEAHAAILTAALDQVRAHGYDAVTMDGIATAAAVGKATVYRRWKSKEALVCEALEQVMRALPAPDTGTLRGDLEALMEEQRALYADPGTASLLSGLVAAMQRSSAIARVVRGGFFAQRQAAMVKVLERALSRRELRPGLDLELALDIFNGPLFYRFLFTGRRIDDATAGGVVTTVLEAFGNPVKRAARARRR